LNTKILHPFRGTEEHKSDLRVAPASTSRAQLRQRGGFAMWTSLFAVTAVIAIALSMAAIIVDSADGGKFRL